MPTKTGSEIFAREGVARDSALGIGNWELCLMKIEGQEERNAWVAQRSGNDDGRTTLITVSFFTHWDPPGQPYIVHRDTVEP